jgi:sugar O-acyltransferase (sialic acid O-acetyltransferase NeuD family)
MSKPLVIFGTGQLAEVAAWYFQHDLGRTIACHAVDAEHISDSTFGDVPVVPFAEISDHFPPSTHDVFVAVGYRKVNGLRQQKCEAARALGYCLPSYVSTRATVLGSPSIGWNAFILENNVIQPFVTIGNGVTMWSGNHIGHHVSIGDFCFISSHVVISGGVKVGARSFIGVNSTLNDHISIGERCVVGSGALVAGDLATESVVTTEPAKLSSVPSRRLRGF